MYRGLCLFMLLACTPQAAPAEPKPAPVAPPPPRSDGTEDIETAIAKRIELREAFMQRLANAQRVWEPEGRRCDERAVGFEPASKYAAELGMPPPDPDATLLVLYRGDSPEVVMYTDPGAIKLADVTGAASSHVVVAMSAERADLRALTESGEVWSLYFSERACEEASRSSTSSSG